MTEARGSGIVIGVLLVLVGAALLAARLIPGFEQWAAGSLGWPLIVCGFGAILALSGLLSRQTGLITGGAVIAGIGGILYYQNQSSDWSSWAYAWTLLPGFAGVGTILAGIVDGSFGRSLRAGLWQILTSALLFFIFASFLGGPNLLGVYWPVLVILLGVILLLRPLLRL